MTAVEVFVEPPRTGCKGPVMSPAPTGDAALRPWDALRVVSGQPGYFEISRPRTNPPRAPAPPDRTMTPDAPVT